MTLPNAFEIDQRHLGNICSRERARRDPVRRAHADRQGDDRRRRCSTSRCAARPTRSRARAACRGSPSSSTARSTSSRGRHQDRSGGRLKTTVPVVPDAPIGHFHLTVFGGKRGYLVNTRDICKNPPVVKVAYTAQNGKDLSENVRIGGCGKRKKK